MDTPPFPGVYGTYIHENISLEAWQNWLVFQVKFINEYQLDLSKVEHKKQLIYQMNTYLNINLNTIL